VASANVELVSQAFDAYGGRDVDRLLSYLDQTFELRSAIVGGAEGQAYLGHDGVRNWLADVDESFADVTIDPSEFRDLGDRVLVFGRIRAVGRESGAQLDSPTGWVVTVRNGKLVRADGFLSRAEALQAAGLTG
jgi:ketosteroid isomerase-like protein